MPVDEGIETLVCALRLLGFKTTASCSGHADRITSGPYVMMESPRGARIYRSATTSPEALKNAQLVTLREASFLLEIVRKWPAEKFEADFRIEVRPVGYAYFRLCFGDADFDSVLESTRYAALLQRRSAALRSFTTYLLEVCLAERGKAAVASRS